MKSISFKDINRSSDVTLIKSRGLEVARMCYNSQSKFENDGEAL